MSDWGQGSKNNNIGWGQGAVNNSINWGLSHSESWAGDTDIVGIDPNQAIINTFKSRVLADGGTFEAESCLKTTLESLNLQYPPLLIESPVVTGNNYAGQTLTTTNGVFDGITPLVYTYQWLLDGSPILGATSSTYVVTSNGTISCKVTATNSFGSSSSTSNEIVPDDRLIFSVKTDNTGISGPNQFIIPTTGTGYLYDIETSDGQSITGLTGGTTITFPSAGTYDVYISGSFPRFYFSNTGDRLKLIDLKNFGIYALGSTSQENAFYGCSNMVISATDIGHFENVTSFYFAWHTCSSLTSFPLLDTSAGTNFGYAWSSCSSLTSFPLIDTSACTNFGYAWRGCSSLTSFPLLDTSAGTNFGYAWAICISLTSFPLIDTSNGTNFSLAWYGCSSLTSFPANAFDTNIASNYASSFTLTKLSTQSIDNILVSLDASGVLNGTFNQSGGGNLPSAVGLAAKANLISKGWTITTN